MNWLLDMAWRNIRRNKRRTILAATSIALSVMLMCFMGGFADGILENMVKNLTKNETGHIRIVTSGFLERSRFMPIDEPIPDPDAVMAAIKAIPELKDELLVVTERLSFGTLLSNGSNTKSAIGFSGDSEREKELLNLNRAIIAGSYLTKNGEAIIGKTLAADLGLDVGDSLRVVTQGADYGLHLKRFTIAGLFATNISQLDGGFFQISVADAKAFLRTDGGVQQVLVMLKNYRKAREASAVITAALAALPGGGDLVVQPWDDIGDYPKMIAMMEGLYGYLYFVIAFLGAFIISNILMMVVLERRKEIGILKSLGLRRRNILFLFIAEGAALGIIGSAIGMVLGLILCGIMSIYGIDLSASMGSINFPVDPIFYTKFDILAGFRMFAIGVLVSIIVSILPSRRAATMNAVDAIKSVA